MGGGSEATRCLLWVRYSIHLYSACRASQSCSFRVTPTLCICTGGDSICTEAIKVRLTLHKTCKKAYLRCSVMHTSLKVAIHPPWGFLLLYAIMAAASKHCCCCRPLWISLEKGQCTCLSVYRENKAKKTHRKNFEKILASPMFLPNNIFPAR